MRRLLHLVLPLLCLAPALAAQEGEEDLTSGAEYFAISSTPVGASSVHTPTAHLTSGLRLRGQFGYIDEEGPFSRRAFLLGLDAPVGGGTGGVSLGLADYACDTEELREFGIDVSCASSVMIGAHWGARLHAAPLGAASETMFDIGLLVSAGASFGDVLSLSDGTDRVEISATNWAAGLSLPLSLAAKSGATLLIPTLSPGVAFGHSSLESQGSIDLGEGSDSGVAMMLAAGLGMVLPSGFGIDVGVRKVFADEAPVILGVGVSLRLR